MKPIIVHNIWSLEQTHDSIHFVTVLPAIMHLPRMDRKHDTAYSLGREGLANLKLLQEERTEREPFLKLYHSGDCARSGDIRALAGVVIWYPVTYKDMRELPVNYFCLYLQADAKQVTTPFSEHCLRLACPVAEPKPSAERGPHIQVRVRNRPSALKCMDVSLQLLKGFAHSELCLCNTRQVRTPRLGPRRMSSPSGSLRSRLAVNTALLKHFDGFLSVCRRGGLRAVG
jgi:hypothetical protein